MSIKSRQIRIYPTAEQRNLFRQWMGVQRLTYNKTIEYLNGIEGKRDNWMAISNLILSGLPDFCREVPYQIKKIAVKDACGAFTSNKVKASKTGKPFKMRFKSRKNPRQSCYIPKSAVKADGIYHTKSGKLFFSEHLPETFGDCRLICKRRKWYLSVPEQITTVRPERQGRTVAIDPGIRKFATFFSVESFGHIGHHDIGMINRLCHHLDDLLSRSSKAHARQRRRMRMAADRLRDRIEDLIDELHWKTIKFLTNNFDVIIYPTFAPSQMVPKSARKISRKSVRSMLNWSFGKFAVRLAHKCAEYGCTLVRISEAYTSQTNTFTGELMNIGGKETYVHEKCKIDRDLAGARNILLRALVDTPLAIPTKELSCIC
jgi:putative transposase